MIRIEWTLNFMLVGPVVGGAEVEDREAAADALAEALREAVGSLWSPEHEPGLRALRAFVLSEGVSRDRRHRRQSFAVPGVAVMVSELPEE